MKAGKRYDNQVCLISALRHVHSNAAALLNIGAERFSLLLFDENGSYRKCKTNSSCAAGTGSFLDQQASRLNLAGIEELGVTAATNTGVIPKIASRCSVFAKTDLIHAQQEGYSLPEICDAVCYGVAKNIVDTLFTGEEVNGPIVVCGGVSKNPAVLRHIQGLIGKDLLVDELSHLYGAFGAAVLLAHDGAGEITEFKSPKDLIQDKKPQRKYACAPLELKLSDYPDFAGIRHYPYEVRTRKTPEKVEVDIYKELPRGGIDRVYLGMDIGSTSTKAVMVDEQKNVLAGFYTWTVGRPVDSLCAVLEAMDDHITRDGVAVEVIGTGTTGSGRKLIGKIINADMVIDEITAHARSACELTPEVDTIIEIGGQDSKFTTLRNKTVTFCAMNTICAAGTGSFIEEQGKKMGCTLDEYQGRAEGRGSPMASNRCTVFMERDMNYYLSEGYSADEMLASALHSVAENYLTKVAKESSIGDTICFQGATAKNRALVAAFEQRLGKPIHVSQYCHLTGALGVALLLADEGVRSENFRGIKLYEKEIPVHSEVCSLCTNHCKLTVAELDDEELAYGFLCGRDYHVKAHIDNNTSGFDLIRARSKAFSFPKKKGHEERHTIGIPDALHLGDDLEFWQYFFDALSIKTITSKGYADAIKEGKMISRAEFCAPLTALHGHVGYLLDKADYVFLPFYLEDKQKTKDVRRQYCYYTQYAPSLVADVFTHDKERILMPLVKYLYNGSHAKVQLYRMMKIISRRRISLRDVSTAYEKALEFKERSLEDLSNQYRREIAEAKGISVVLLGRPYTVLPPVMNNGIIDLFASKGIKVFSHDMLPLNGHKPDENLKDLLHELPWKHAANILQAADLSAKTDGLYPVLVTSFQCSPDSFVAEYFKTHLDSYAKPYLILQLDEHDSNVGYETRIEAAISSFRNHFMRFRKNTPRAPSKSILPVKSFADRILYFPKWDHLSCRLVVASLKREGIDARLTEGNEASLLTGLKYNTGQCIPINIMAQEFIDSILKDDMDPSRCALWMCSGTIACNLKMIPHHIKNILNSHGKGMERADVYLGEISMMDISLRSTVNVYLAFMFGGLLRRVGCKIRPYETMKGMTDKVMEEALCILDGAFEGLRSKEDALKEVTSLFEKIPRRVEKRPQVAIFGDGYVRDNDFVNQGLIRFIEEQGGEVITTPDISFLKMIASPYFKKWIIEGEYLFAVLSKAYWTALELIERRYYRYFELLLKEPVHEYRDSTREILAGYNLLPEHTGESMENIIKSHYIKKYHPDVSLFIHTSPAFCCPALVTDALAKKIEEMTGVPLVNITYDGTCSAKNNALIPYLAFSNKDAKQHVHDMGQIERILGKSYIIVPEKPFISPI
ncbi:MAG: acyl-CoA dehydratase activase [Deltaproteobacteria bacterium]|nr:acyl-CoA dehydratase activase [Deltaproteobacteria bacterium]